MKAAANATSPSTIHRAQSKFRGVTKNRKGAEPGGDDRNERARLGIERLRPRATGVVFAFRFRIQQIGPSRWAHREDPGIRS